MDADNIEWGEWVDGGDFNPSFRHLQCEYRNGLLIRHRIGKPRAPVVTEQVLYWQIGCTATKYRTSVDTHSITITLHDGDPAGINIEALK